MKPLLNGNPFYCLSILTMDKEREDLFLSYREYRILYVRMWYFNRSAYDNYEEAEPSKGRKLFFILEFGICISYFPSLALD